MPLTTRMPRLDQRFWKRTFFLAILSALGHSTGQALASTGPFSAPLWPELGIAVGWLWVFGTESWPALPAGILASGLIAGVPYAFLLPIALGHTAAALSAVWLFRALFHARSDLTRLRDAVALLFGGAILGPGFGALISAALTSPRAGLASPLEGWSRLFLPSVAGVATAAPAVLALAHQRDALRALRNREFLGWHAFLALSGLAIFYADFSFPFVVVIPFLIGLALRFHIVGASSGLLLIGGIAVAATIQGFGPFAAGGHLDLISLQMFLTCTAGTVLVVAAVTRERVEAEGRLVAQAELMQRFDCLGTMATAMAHDLNNLLGPIRHAVKLLRSKPGDETDEEILSSIDLSAQKGIEIVGQVLGFARGSSPRNSEVQVGPLVREIVKVCRATFPPGIVIRGQVEENLGPLMADIMQLRQMLFNLCVNARDAMPQGGRLTISASQYFCEPNGARLSPDAREGPYVRFTVSDTGSGIPSEIMEKIFEPFFTTKSPEAGTGLGLATVSRIVKNHGGFLRFQSRANEGAGFEVYLPAEARKLEASGEQSGAGELSGGTALKSG